jgi:hypothetical protein
MWRLCFKRRYFTLKDEYCASENAIFVVPAKAFLIYATTSLAKGAGERSETGDFWIALPRFAYF